MFFNYNTKIQIKNEFSKYYQKKLYFGYLYDTINNIIFNFKSFNMENKKPNVIPTQEQIAATNTNADERLQAQPHGVSAAEKAAADEMLRRTEEQFRLRNEALAKQKDLAAKAEAGIDALPGPDRTPPALQTTQVPDSPAMAVAAPNVVAVEPKQVNAPYDLIPLPSEGKLYKHKKSKIKVAFLNASDENILTAPHLVESGEFMDILFRRKVIEDGIDYKDLHVGDRNAIMVWLRATAYGPNYPIQVINPETGEFIESEVDLSTLKTKKLGAEPDRNGCFDYKFPVCGKTCKFRLLTVGDVEDIERQERYELETLKKPYADVLTYRLEKQITEVDGNSDINFIRDFISVLRVGDSRGLRKYTNEIESGLDMNIEVQVPGGEPFKTFLPIGFNFFWPEL